jgi:hypothetical protein
MELVDQSHLPPPEDGQLLIALCVHVLAIQINLPAGWHVHSRNGVEQRRFPGTGGANDRGKVSLVNGEGNVVQCQNLIIPFAIGLAKVFDV